MEDKDCDHLYFWITDETDMYTQKTSGSYDEFVNFRYTKL